jgi:hypothetical protein
MADATENHAKGTGAAQRAARIASIDETRPHLCIRGRPTSPGITIAWPIRSERIDC